MTQYNTLNVKLSNSQLIKLKSGIKTFVNSWSANIKFSKTQLSKIVQLGGFVDRFFDLLNSQYNSIDSI